MEENHFDAFVQFLGAALTRRTTLGGTLAALLATAHSSGNDLEAKKRHKKKKRKKKRKPKTKADAACAPDGTFDSLSGAARFAQTFVALHAGKLTKASFSLRQNGEGSDFIVEIRDVNGQDEPDTVLATATVKDVPATQTSDPPRVIPVTFANPATVTAGLRFALAVTNAVGEPFALLANHTAATCPDMAPFIDFDANGDFVEEDKDLVFATFVKS